MSVIQITEKTWSAEDAKMMECILAVMKIDNASMKAKVKAFLLPGIKGLFALWCLTFIPLSPTLSLLS